MSTLIQERRTNLQRLAKINFQSIKALTHSRAQQMWNRISKGIANAKAYRDVARQRRMLAQMPDYLLKDIGVSRAEALHEANKPFWK